MSTKPIPPKTAAKLSEAEDYLSEMRRTSENTAEFARLVSNFLTAARSVKDVLINEIAQGNKALKNRIKAPVQARMKADREMKALVDARNATIHEGVLSLRIDWVEDAFPRSSGDNGVDDFLRRHRLRRVGTRSVHRSHIVRMQQARELIGRAFLPDISDRDAYTVCVEHLAKVRTAIDECVQKYG